MLYFLNGFMGSGKSYWGRRWATAFDLEFHDLDDVIERQEGMTISELFKTKGEPAFRRIERDALARMCSKSNAIIACGGGTPCFHDNMKRMSRAGITIWLKTPLEALVERLLPELGHRPVIAHTNADTLAGFIEGKLAEREPFYHRCVYHFYTPYLTDENFKKILDKCKRHS
ncbi:shikimate kinase [Dinghuibacter silviterrae]|uniref:Shikimate kinase n=1 Tax=Dinghuibacter silviterrae TaxID=1539049 RepID=A0A4V3GLT1_9BACT|nr:shikimate kinase [Dinghuibacter silviterrae]TDX00703.1 shikimate kinase [Dinghuibacter silviterrae]